MKTMLTQEDFWLTWNRFNKVTFDGTNKLIMVNPYVFELSIKEDVYSEWKRWLVRENNIRYEFALRSVGGGGMSGLSFFLVNGWRLKCDMKYYTAIHLVSGVQDKQYLRQLSITGNIFVANSSSSIFAP